MSKSESHKNSIMSDKKKKIQDILYRMYNETQEESSDIKKKEAVNADGQEVANVTTADGKVVASHMNAEVQGTEEGKKIQKELGIKDAAKPSVEGMVSDMEENGDKIPMPEKAKLLGKSGNPHVDAFIHHYIRASISADKANNIDDDMIDADTHWNNLSATNDAHNRMKNYHYFQIPEEERNGAIEAAKKTFDSMSPSDRKKISSDVFEGHPYDKTKSRRQQIIDSAKTTPEPQDQKSGPKKAGISYEEQQANKKRNMAVSNINTKRQYGINSTQTPAPEKKESTPKKRGHLSLIKALLAKSQDAKDKEKDDKSKSPAAKAIQNALKGWKTLQKGEEHPHDSGSEMQKRQLKELLHHIQEAFSSMGNKDLPDWLESKIAEASKTMSEVAHYLEHEKTEGMEKGYNRFSMETQHMGEELPEEAQRKLHMFDGQTYKLLDSLLTYQKGITAKQGIEGGPKPKGLKVTRADSYESEVTPDLSKSKKKDDKPFKGYNKEKHARTGGLNEKARKKYNRENNANLKAPVTGKPKAGSKDAKRKKSFCARMSGVKGPTSKDGELTPKGAALKRWNCNKSFRGKFTKSTENLEKVKWEDQQRNRQKLKQEQNQAIINKLKGNSLPKKTQNHEDKLIDRLELIHGPFSNKEKGHISAYIHHKPRANYPADGEHDINEPSHMHDWAADMHLYSLPEKIGNDLFSEESRFRSNSSFSSSNKYVSHPYDRMLEAETTIGKDGRSIPSPKDAEIINRASTIAQPKTKGHLKVIKSYDGDSMDKSYHGLSNAGATMLKSMLAKRCWEGYKPVPGKKPYSKGSCVKKSEDMQKGLNGDWSQEGYEIKHGKLGKIHHVSAHKDGVLVGQAELFEKNGSLVPRYTQVDKNHRRKGLADAMYNHAEGVFGKKVVPSPEQTKDAKALWSKRMEKGAVDARKIEAGEKPDFELQPEHHIKLSKQYAELARRATKQGEHAKAKFYISQSKKHRESY